MKPKLIAPLVPVLLVALGLLVAPLASAASKPSVQNGVVHACMKVKGKRSQRGMIRIVGPAQKCNAKQGWKALNWNIAGAAGAKGDTGPQGTAGTKGANGSNGSNGAQGEKGSDATVETQLKEVIAAQTDKIEKLTNEVSVLTGGLLNLTRTVQGVKGTVDTTVTTLTSLTGKVGTQCSALNEVSTQANGLLGGINQLTGLLGILGTNPLNLPGTTAGATC
jgi:Collagen triple helix repeat (20 copies)